MSGPGKSAARFGLLTAVALGGSSLALAAPTRSADVRDGKNSKLAKAGVDRGEERGVEVAKVARVDEASKLRDLASREHNGIGPLKARVDTALERSGLPKSEIALQRSFVQAALDNPGLQGEALLARVDASSQLATMRWVLPEMEKAVNGIQRRVAATEKDLRGEQEDGEGELNDYDAKKLREAKAFAGYFAERLEAAKTLVNRTDVKPSYFEVLQTVADYLHASEYGGNGRGRTGPLSFLPDIDELRSHPLRISDEAAFGDSLTQAAVYRIPVFATRAPTPDERVNASAAGLQYLELLGFDETRIIDGVDSNNVAAAAQGVSNYGGRWDPNRRETSHKVYLEGSQPEHVSAFLAKAADGLALAESFQQFKSSFSNLSDREAAECEWFLITHQNGNEVVRADLVASLEQERALHFGEALKRLASVERGSSKDQTQPRLTLPKQATKDRLMRVSTKLLAFLENGQGGSAPDARRIEALDTRMTAALEGSGLPKDEIALQKSFVRGSLQHPGVDGMALMAQVDASSQLPTVRWVLPEMEKAVQALDARVLAAERKRAPAVENHDSHVERDVAKLKAIAAYYAERLAAAKAVINRPSPGLKGRPQMNYFEYLRTMADYIHASDFAHYDRAEEASEDYRDMPDVASLRANPLRMYGGGGFEDVISEAALYRFVVFTPRSLNLDEMVTASAAGIHYIGLLKFDEHQMADGISRSNVGFAAHDAVHLEYMWSHAAHVPGKKYLNGTQPEHVAAFLEKAADGLALTARFVPFKESFGDLTDRELVDWLWFQISHEDSSEVSRDDLAQTLTFEREGGFGETLRRVADKADLAPLFTHPGEVTRERLMNVSAKLLAFLKSDVAALPKLATK